MYSGGQRVEESEKSYPCGSFFCFYPSHPLIPIDSKPVHTVVTVVIIHYRTPDLLQTAVQSFQVHYPDVRIVIVDNGSDDDAVNTVNELVASSANVSAMMLTENIYHGPAMHRAIIALKTPYVFMLDSDTETQRGGFLESMIQEFHHENVYAVGQTVRVNKRGFATSGGRITVPVSAYMLFDRLKYSKLPPFIHHGLPVLNNFTAAASRGWTVADYPVHEYVEHFGRGTASRFGYKLGLRGKIDFLLNKLGL